MFKEITEEATRCWKNGEDWRVEIKDTSISWYPPIPAHMQSFEMQLFKIKTTRRIFTQTRGRRGPSRSSFYIEKVDGEDVEIDLIISGVSRTPVFNVLKSYGMEYKTEHEVKRYGLKTG